VQNLSLCVDFGLKHIPVNTVTGHISGSVDKNISIQERPQENFILLDTYSNKNFNKKGNAELTLFIENLPI
jgi:hypothetical protein